MKITVEQTKKIFEVDDLIFKTMGFSMLVTNLKKFHAMAPNMYTLEDCTAEINKFLDKFASTMEEDYRIIEKI